MTTGFLDYLMCFAESGMVVKAWDLAVATMKVGEKSRFYCKDIYVYTDEAAQSTDSPQQSHTIYDIELLSCQGFSVCLCRNAFCRYQKINLESK